MTNTERIQANNAELREAIEMAETLPDAGGGGSGGYETCTIEVVCGRGITEFEIYVHALTCVSNNEVQANAFLGYGNPKNGTEMVFENVLCGSAMYIEWYASGGLTLAYASINMECLDDGFLFVAPTQNGEVGVITIYDAEAGWG